MPGQSREKLGPLMQRGLGWFEAVIYVLVSLLLVAAAGFVLIATVEAIIQSLTGDALKGGILVLDRILLTLIVAEFAYTLRVVIATHEISAEPFLFIGLIAVVRRILIVTAQFEQPQSDEELVRLLLELGMLGVLVLGLAAAIYLIRRSSERRTAEPPAVAASVSAH